MRLRKKILVITLITSAVFYLADVLLDLVLHYPGHSFLQLAIISPPSQEMYSRSFAIVAILASGLFISEFMDRQRKSVASPRNGNYYKFSQDPELLSNLVQQIRIPLNAINGFSGLLMEPGTSSESKSLYINHIHTSGNYMMELINNIVDITRIETGQMINNKVECKLNPLMTDIFEKYQLKLIEKNKADINLKLKTGIKDENYTLLADKEKMEQVVINLLENSLAFTDSGEIEFGYRKKDDLFLEFFVRDTGVGFSVDRLEQIMNQSTHVFDNRMRPFDTAALRINLSKHLAKIMGGKLTTDSVFGEGSTFAFTIPLNVVEVWREEDVKTNFDVNTVNWADKKILIAEDVKSNFIYLEAILDPTRVQVHWVKNGKEAVRYCKINNDIDLVLMDILMPEMDGYEAARLIKKSQPRLPIIAQTAFSLDEEEYKASQKSFSKYLIKPIWSHDLLNTLSEYL
jgi:signal transduction histidine kinase